MRYLNFLGYAAIPAAFLIHLWLGHGQSWEPLVTFSLAGLGVIPLASLMGHATEHLSERAGPTWGGLLNATFGNAAELIIGIIAISKGLNEIVKASITGSIIGNLVLVAGASMLYGGWKRDRQTFSRGAVEANAGLLGIAVAGMLIPAIFHYTVVSSNDPSRIQHEHTVSIGASLILMAVYILGMFFTLKTHSHLFTPAPAQSEEDPIGLSGKDAWSTRRSILVLFAASVGVAVVAELLVGATEQMAHSLGWNHIFVGVILLAIVGNAAEHSTALLLAGRNDMDTAMTIVHQSSVQIALIVAPILVFTSILLAAMGVGGVTQLDLVFTPLEVAAVVLSVGVGVLLALNGESNWFEGALLLALYAIFAVAFYCLPAA